MPSSIQKEMRRSRWRRLSTGILVTLCTLLVLFVVLEIGVRLVIPATSFQPLPNVYVPHAEPSLGYTLRPLEDRVAFGVPVRANREGFRGPDWTREKPPNTRRIALIGDSHAFGYGVDFRATVGETLGRLLDAAEPGVAHQVLNFALPGYNATQQRSALEACAAQFAPDAVVVMFCNNDHRAAFWADPEGFLHRGARGEGGAGTRLLSWPEKGWIRARSGLLGKSRLLLYLRLQWLRYRQKERRDDERNSQVAVTDPLRPDAEQVAAATLDPELLMKVWGPLSEVGTWCKQHEVPVVFACASSGPPWLKMLHQLGETFGAPTLGLFSLFPEVDTYGELQRRFSLGWDSHLNAEAHRRWAVGLAKLLHPK